MNYFINKKYKRNFHYQLIYCLKKSSWTSFRYYDVSLLLYKKNFN